MYSIFQKKKNAAQFPVVNINYIFKNNKSNFLYKKQNFIWVLTLLWYSNLHVKPNN